MGEDIFIFRNPKREAEWALLAPGTTFAQFYCGEGVLVEGTSKLSPSGFWDRPDNLDYGLAELRLADFSLTRTRKGR